MDNKLLTKLNLLLLTALVIFSYYYYANFCKINELEQTTFKL